MGPRLLTLAEVAGLLLKAAERVPIRVVVLQDGVEIATSTESFPDGEGRKTAEWIYWWKKSRRRSSRERFDFDVREVGYTPPLEGSARSSRVARSSRTV